MDHQYRHYIEEWFVGNKTGEKYEGEVSNHVRRWLHETRGAACEKCGWDKINPTTNKTPLTVNHIDGNSNNHRPANLELICPCCHSLTPNYGSLNRGHGRKKRIKQIIDTKVQDS